MATQDHRLSTLTDYFCRLWKHAHIVRSKLSLANRALPRPLSPSSDIARLISTVQGTERVTVCSHFFFLGKAIWGSAKDEGRRKRGGDRAKAAGRGVTGIYIHGTLGHLAPRSASSGTNMVTIVGPKVKVN